MRRPLPFGLLVLYTSIAAGSFASTPPAPSLVPTVAVRHRAAVATAQPSASSASAQAAVAEEPLQQPPRAIPTGPSPLGLLVLALGSLGGIALATKLLASLSGAWVGGAKLVFAAAVAGVISRTCCAPLEMVSTVMMCRGDECGSMGEELADAWRHDGMSGLFKGNGANCLKVAPSRGTQFLVYEFVKRQMVAGAAAGAVLSAGNRLVAGGIAGMVAALLVYPLEVIKTMLTIYPEECKATPGGAIGCVIKAGGVRGLYAGVVPTLIAMFPYVGVEFMVYETLKRRWELWAGAPAGTLTIILLGAVGGACAQASAHPLDVIRRRLQLGNMAQASADGTQKPKPPYSNMVSGLYTVGKTEGLHVLFRGLGPACFEKVPSTAIGYYIYELMKRLLRVASV